MNNNLTCNQVASVINLYIKNMLSPKMNEYVKQHIENCPTCKKKIAELKSILAQYTEPIQKNDTPKLSESLFTNLSAYVDNELNNNENIKIKKATISNPNVRKKLEAMYLFKKLMLSAYERTKNDYKTDNSKNIIAQVINTTDYSTSYFTKIIILFCIVITAILCCFIYLYL